MAPGVFPAAGRKRIGLSGGRVGKLDHLLGFSLLGFLFYAILDKAHGNNRVRASGSLESYEVSRSLPVKIAIFHDLPSGGAKRALHAFCHELSRRGHHLDLFMPETANEVFLPLAPFLTSVHVFPLSGARKSAEHHPAVWTPTAWFMAGRCHRGMAEAIDRGKYDLVFAHQARYPNIPGVLKYLKTPTVLYLQEPNRLLYETAVSDSFGESKTSLRQRIRNNPLIGPPLFSFIHRKMEDQNNIRHAHTVLANSYYSRESILRVYGISATVVYLGVDTALFRPMNLQREQLVLAIGAVHPSKGHRFLIDSVGRISANRRPKVMIIADREKAGEKELLMRMAADQGVALIIQSVTDDELVRCYNRAAIVAVLAHLEPFGFTPLEAMACETPVIGIREGGIRESVINGKTGFLLDRDPEACADALVKLLDDESLRAEMGRAGRCQVESHWTWSQATDRLERVFEKVRFKTRDSLTPKI